MYTTDERHHDRVYPPLANLSAWRGWRPFGTVTDLVEPWSRSNPVLLPSLVPGASCSCSLYVVETCGRLKILSGWAVGPGILTSWWW